MGTKKEKRQYTTLDAYRAGFLKFKGHNLSIAAEHGHKIVFSFPLTPTLLRDIEDYENGAQVDAFRYSLVIKSLKAMIFSAKGAPHA